MRWFFLLLPWIELFTLIQLGVRIGALQALLYVFATFLLGLTILRAQGMEIVGKLRTAQSGGVIPAQLLADELALGLAGLLLIIPGLITDAFAVLVLFGPARRRVFAALGGTARGSKARGSSANASDRVGPDGRGSQPGPGDPIEGEYRRLDDE